MTLDFNSFETGEPFSHCCDCGDELLQAENTYVVNKSYVGDECIFEFALCMDCRNKMQAKLSEKSRVAMFDFMHDRSDMDSREKNLGHGSPTDDYLSHCITCQQPRGQSKGYTLGALFTGEMLIKGPFPILMCSQCEETLAETISDETRKAWDTFIGENFPGPPSEVQLPKTSKPIFI